MSSSRVFVARLAGTPVYDPAGDPVGVVRDVVASLRLPPHPPRVIGLVIEIPGRRRVFLAMTRVTNIDPGQVVSTGLLNVRRFQRRPTEVLLIGEMLDRQVTIRRAEMSDSRASDEQATVYDVGMEQTRTRDWVIVKLAVLHGRRSIRRKRDSVVLDWEEVSGATEDLPDQAAARLLSTLENMRAADLAKVLHDLPAKRRLEVAAELDDARLADVLEELPDGDRVAILDGLPTDRAADVVEEMSPDDAADLVADLAPDVAEQVLARMEPKEAEDVRRLMTYDDLSAGGLMTSEPIILPPDATVADALARVRIPESSPALASMVFVCRPPLETPTGKFLGSVHFQRLLREPPSLMVSSMLDTELGSLQPSMTLTEVATFLATYNLVSAPVIDADGHLIGAVTVDDVLDNLLPSNWREAAAELPL